jgi:hypothetical protein
MARKRNRGSQRYTTAEFKPYVTALGQLALAWNDLQESFAGLFWTLMLSGPPRAGDMVDYRPLRIWHAVKSDRYQRDMLRVLAAHSENINWGRPALVDDVKWLLGEAGKLEDLRNDAIHSPLFFSQNWLSGSAKVVPASWQLNPRALSLGKRADLLGAFRYCRDTALILSDFAREIETALVNRGAPWPGRPQLPNRGDGHGTHRSRTKPPRPPRPSQN